MSQELLFISPVFRQIVLPATGISARFEAGVPRPLRKNMRQYALSQGILPYKEGMEALMAAVTEDADDIMDDAADLSDFDDGGAKSIDDVIAQMVAEGSPDEFGKDGAPSVRAIEKRMDANISASDRDAAWARFNAEAGE